MKNGGKLLIHQEYKRCIRDSPHPYPDMVARLQSVISEEIKNHIPEHLYGATKEKLTDVISFAGSRAIVVVASEQVGIC